MGLYTMQILGTMHGSHLYGLAHEQSDYDFYIVDSHEKTRQTILGRADIHVVNFDDFLAQVAKGVPQALEALFSPVAIRHPHYAPMLSQLRLPLYSVQETYRRTIKSFYMKGIEESDMKFVKHAIRLDWNIQDLMEYGYFNPKLSGYKREALRNMNC